MDNEKIKNEPIETLPITLTLQSELKTAKESQDTYDILRLFKRRRHQEISQLESAPFENRQKIFFEITKTAEIILFAAFEHMQTQLESQFGFPSFLNSYNQITPAHLGIIGMGKLGSREMNYESDIDIIFVYSHRGETMGRKKITNQEYFAKFAQKYLNLLSLTTSAGRCYEMDVELRPSGNLGMLVSSFDHFIDHQMNQAQEWEHMALLRARPILAPLDFKKNIELHIDELAHKRPLPNDFFRKMHAIRQKVLQQKASEQENMFDLKLGKGGLMDVEFILQGIEMKFQHLYTHLQQRSLFSLIQNLKNQSILAEKNVQELEEAHLTFHTVISQIHLEERRSYNRVHYDSDLFEKISGRLALPKKELKENLLQHRAKVSKIYSLFYENT